MKRFHFLLFLLFALSSTGFSQSNEVKNPTRLTFASSGRVKFEDLRKRNVLKISPFHFFDRTLNIGNESFLNNRFNSSIYVALNGTYFDSKNKVDKGVSLDIQGRYYPRGFRADSSAWIRNGANGFFVGFGVTFGINQLEQLDYYDYTTSRNSKYTINSQWITPSVVFGYQLIAWESLYFDVFLGGGLKINDVKYETEIPSDNFNTDIISEANIFSRYYKGILPKAGFTLGVGL